MGTPTTKGAPTETQTIRKPNDDERELAPKTPPTIARPCLNGHSTQEMSIAVLREVFGTPDEGIDERLMGHILADGVEEHLTIHIAIRDLRVGLDGYKRLAILEHLGFTTAPVATYAAWTYNRTDTDGSAILLPHPPHGWHKPDEALVYGFACSLPNPKPIPMRLQSLELSAALALQQIPDATVRKPSETPRRTATEPPSEPQQGNKKRLGATIMASSLLAGVVMVWPQDRPEVRQELARAVAVEMQWHIDSGYGDTPEAPYEILTGARYPWDPKTKAKVEVRYLGGHDWVASVGDAHQHFAVNDEAMRRYQALNAAERESTSMPYVPKPPDPKMHR